MSLPSLRIVGLITALSLTARPLEAQVANYDPEYDDEEAAGTIENAAEQGPIEGRSPGTAAGDTGRRDGAPDTPPSAVDDGTGAEPVSAAPVDRTAAAGEERDSAREAVDDESEGRERRPWEWGGSRPLAGLDGSTGLFYTAAAGSDEMGTFSVGIHGAFFKYTDYLVHGDENTSMWAGLTLRVTPWDYIEAYAGLQSRSNYNEKAEPALFQSLGDFHLGVKGFYPVLPVLSAGLIFGVAFKNPVGEVDVAFNGLSIPLGIAGSVDFSEINDKIPLKAHLNVLYRFDNSGQLVADLEKKRGGCDSDANGDGTPDYRGCLDPVERTALDIDRLDQLRIGLGIEATLPYVTPLIEYTLEVPINRQDFVCPRQQATSNAVTCMDDAGFGGMRQWLTFGVRVLPPIETLTIDLGVDYGLAGFAPSVHELAAQAPYRILFGLTYNFDPFPASVTRTVTPTCPEPASLPTPVPARAPAPVVVGFVHDAVTGAALSGATVVYRGLGVTAQVTGSDGKFTSYGLRPGERVTVDVTLEGYERGTFAREIPERLDGTSVMDRATPEYKLACPLQKRKDLGELTLRVTEESGDTLAGVTIAIEGPRSFTGQTDASGEIPFKGEGGEYAVSVTKPGYFEKRRTVTLVPQQATAVALQMSRVPEEASVELSKERIKIKKQIMFSRGSESIAAESFGLLDEIAETLRSHPDIKLVEIQGHTDNRGKRSVNVALSQQRADAVREYLTGEGIAPDRLRAKGYGALQPRAPNITSSGRAKNRRVEFHIIETAD